MAEILLSPSSDFKMTKKFSSNPVSTQSSPSNLAVEFSDKSIFDFSFFEFNKEIKGEETDNRAELTKANSSESLNFSKDSLVNDLEAMLSQTKILNSKLERNLKALQERESKQAILIESLARKSRKKGSVDMLMKEEVACSCVKGCLLF
jgi:hypothetical protein